MKKTRFIALVLVAAIALMGAGYALWGDTIILNETVTMGNVNMGWEWNRVVADGNGVFYATLDGVRIPVTNGSHVYSKDNLSEDKDTLTIDVQNLYPGAVVAWYGSCVNWGSLPVKLDKVDVDINNTDLGEYLEVYYDTNHYDASEGKWGTKNVKGFRDFDELETTMNTDDVFKGYTLETGDLIQFGDEEEGCIKIKIKDTIPQDFEKESATITLTFDFVQAY